MLKLFKLNQTNYPYLWLLFQKTIGSNKDKIKLALKGYNNEKSVLEIGCSLGNVTECFVNYPNINYTGIDIDDTVISIAKRRFAKNANFNFRNVSLQLISSEGAKFDYILFGGILHHVDNSTANELLNCAKKLVTANGKIVIYEPDRIRKSDNILHKFFNKYLELGTYLRTSFELKELLHNNNLIVEQIEEIMLSPGIIERPYYARFIWILSK